MIDAADKAQPVTSKLLESKLRSLGGSDGKGKVCNAVEDHVDCSLVKHLR